MKEIILLIEVPGPNYSNGIAESNKILLKDIRDFSKVYFFEDKPFHKVKFYFFAKLISFLYFLKNYFFFILSRVKKRLKSVDYLYVVISVNSPLGIVKNFLQIIFLYPFSRRIIIHIHRSDIRVFNDYYISFANKIINKLQEYILSCSFKIIVLSKELTKFNLLNNHKEKVFILKNTLDLELETLLLSSPINIPKNINKTKFFFYSNILKSKGVSLYLDLFNNNKYLNPKFSVIAGYPNEKELVENAVTNNHRFIGHIRKEMKNSLFSENDCIIFTSPNEGLPLILLEAMASGVFIISSNVGFIPELLGECYPFMCKPKLNEFSRVIENYFNLSENQRYEIILNQRKRYINLFSHEIWSKNTQLIFE